MNAHDVKRHTDTRFERGFDLADKWGYRNNEATRISEKENLLGQKEQLLELQKTQQSLERQACEDKFAISKQVADCCSELKVQAADNKAALELLNTKNHLDVKAQLAECCCDLKELVRAENNQTRDLFQQNEIAELRQKLSDCKTREVFGSERNGPGNN